MEIKMEILTHVIDTRSLGTLYLSVMRSSLNLVSKEFRDILLFLVGNFSSPFKEKYVKRKPLNLGEILRFRRAWRSHNLMLKLIVPGTYFLLENGNGSKREITSIGITKDYIFCVPRFSNKLEIYDSFPISEPIIEIKDIETFCQNASHFMDAQDTSIGVVTMFSSALGVYFFKLNPVKGELEFLIKFPGGDLFIGYYGIYEDQKSLFYPWRNPMSSENPIYFNRNYPYTVAFFIKVEDRYMECEAITEDGMLRVYDTLKNKVHLEIKGGNVSFGSVSQDIEGLIAINRERNSVIMDVLTKEILYISPRGACIEAVTTEDKGFNVWLDRISFPEEMPSLISA